MKSFYFCVLQFVVFSVNVLFAQDRISVLDDQLVFYVPAGTILEFPRREFASYEEQKKFFDGKIGILVTIFNESVITDLWRFSSGMENLVKSRRLKQGDFLHLLSTSKEALTFSSPGVNDTEAIRAFFKYNGITTGELYGSDSGTDNVAPSYHGYLIELVVGDNIVNIGVRLHDEYRNLAKRMPEYFYYEDKAYKNYLWRDFDSLRDSFYQKLNSDRYRELPYEFQKLRETLDMVLNTITIPGYPRHEIYKTEAALRMRETAALSSGVITTIPKDSQVKVIEEGAVQIIDGIAARWVKVETIKDNQRGWCFAGYLQPVSSTP
jgi:hypothetical protein